MTRFHGALLVVAVCLLSAVPAAGQIVGNPIEVSGHAGYFKPDDRARTAEGPSFSGTVGIRLQPWMTLEGHALFAPSDQDSGAALKHNFSLAGIDARFNLLPPEGRVVPFLLVGAGYGLSRTSVAGNDEKLERGAASLGLGALWNIRDQRTSVRFQVRDVMFRERGPREFSNHMAVSLGLHYVFGGREQDSDLDGVRDRLDRCPDTPFGANVDAHGCPIDTDGDAVFDGLDQCEGTLAGCVVDENGCAVDSDGDGVCDGLDQCADTPAGASVDAKGCPADLDGDGVLAGLDQCPDTPKGCTVDENGCSTDSDGDGVCDGVDQCPNTPDSTAVNAAGCPFQLGPVETQLLQTGRVRIRDVNFASARGDLQTEIFPLLRTLGSIMRQYPELQFELAGYTDDRGDEAAAERMSLARATAVQAWFAKNTPDFANVKLSVNGYGADGVGDKARYVELRVLNTGAVPAELEKRQPPPGAVPQGGTGDAVPGSGGSPPDSTGGE
jgi:outer membrane protein OmpA-like peptidoglycan-associated protein